MEMNLLAILWSSGIIVKVVLFLLIACSVYSWAIILQKRKYMKVVLDKDKEFMEHYRTLQGFSEIKSKDKTQVCLNQIKAIKKITKQTRM